MRSVQITEDYKIVVTLTRIDILQAVVSTAYGRWVSSHLAELDEEALQAFHYRIKTDAEYKKHVVNEVKAICDDIHNELYNRSKLHGAQGEIIISAVDMKASASRVMASSYISDLKID